MAGTQVNRDKKIHNPENLVALKDSSYDRNRNDDSDTCFRCGRSGHWAEDCYAATDVDGDDLEGDQELDEDDDLDDDELDDDWDDEDDF